MIYRFSGYGFLPTENVRTRKVHQDRPACEAISSTRHQPMQREAREVADGGGDGRDTQGRPPLTPPCAWPEGLLPPQDA